jgi:putative phosphoesterase
MRTAIISDIHGNRRAFQSVLADLKHIAPDLIVHGGDLAFGGAHPAEVIDHIRALGWLGVRGNTDEVFWFQEPLIQMAANPKLAPLLAALQSMIPPMSAAVGEERLQWLKTLPTLYAHESFSVVHASPDNLWRSPVPESTDDEFQSTYLPLRAQTVVYGHIHRPFIRRLPSGMTVANTGSVSQSYDGDRRASYLLIEDGNLAIRRVDYDVEAEANDLLHSGLPHADWLARILRAGKYVPPE